MRRDTIIFLVGPTAVGKTRLAVKLARRIDGEVISADSMQVYKGMDILSQAPGPSERGGVRHHMVGSLDPANEYSAAHFRAGAVKTIDRVLKKGKVPIVAGGSGLYIKCLIDGLFPSPRADKAFRRKMEDSALKYGSERLHDRLERIDPQAAAKIHPNDKRRIIRALELYHSTGRTMTALKSETRGLEDIYRIKLYGLTKRREDIYSSINGRVEAMFEKGLVKEVKRLMRRKLSKTARAALGYKEVKGYLEGGYSLEDAKELLKMNTRRFAKRQISWFRPDRRIRWFDLGKIGEKEAVNKIAWNARY